MNKSTLYWLKIAIFVALLVFIDQISKYLSKVHIKGNNNVELIPNILSLKYLEGGNSGAAWGLLSGRLFIFIAFTVVALAIIIKILYNIFLIYKENYSLNPRITLLKYMLIVLVAGAIGNLIDRILYGSVVDFISFDFIKFPIFNIADIYVTVSCVLLLIICIFVIDNKTFNKIFRLRKYSNDE